MTRSLIINPDRSCERSDEPAFETARRVIGDAVDVVSVRHPLFPQRRFVLIVDDWGAVKEQPVNIKAWGLYGGSPLFGVAVLGDDSLHEIDEEYLTLIEGDDFPDAIILAQMRAFLTKDTQ